MMIQKLIIICSILIINVQFSFALTQRFERYNIVEICQGNKLIKVYSAGILFSYKKDNRDYLKFIELYNIKDKRQYEFSSAFKLTQDYITTVDFPQQEPSQNEIVFKFINFSEIIKVTWSAGENEILFTFLNSILKMIPQKYRGELKMEIPK